MACFAQCSEGNPGPPVCSGCVLCPKLPCLCGWRFGMDRTAQFRSVCSTGGSSAGEERVCVCVLVGSLGWLHVLCEWLGWGRSLCSLTCPLLSVFSSVLALCRFGIYVCVCTLTYVDVHLSSCSFGCMCERAAVMLPVCCTLVWCWISPSYSAVWVCTAVCCLKVW